MIYKSAGEMAEHLARHALAHEHKLDDREHAEIVAQLRLSPSHVGESEEELYHRAAYALIWKNHLQRRNASLEDRLTTIETEMKRTHWLLVGLALLVLLLLAFVSRAHAQDSVTIRGAGKGTTTAAPVPATPNGPNHTAFDPTRLN